MPIQIQGPIGPFRDNVQQRDVAVIVDATCDALPNGPVADLAGLERHVQQEMLRAIRQVVAPKMASREIQFNHLSMGQVGYLIPEIIAASGLLTQGLRIENLSMGFGIDGHPPYLRSGAPAPQASPSNVASGPAMPNIHANLHVGGFNLHASTKGGVDAAGLANQVVDRAKSTILWYALAGLLVLLIVGGVGLYLASVISSSIKPGAMSAEKAKWDGKSSLLCAGNDVITINGVTSNLSETPINAAGECSLTLVNVDITGPMAINAAGNAVVVVKGGALKGSPVAVQALGAAKVTLSGTKVTGKTQALGAAKITGP